MSLFMVFFGDVPFSLENRTYTSLLDLFENKQLNIDLLRLWYMKYTKRNQYSL